MSLSKQKTEDYTIQVFKAIGKKLYLNSELADVHFIFEKKDGEYDRVPAHKLVLSSASEVFQTMFNGSWKEKDEVKIGDAPVSAFREFLQFFYLDHANLTTENVAKVLNLGQMYNIDECLTVCIEFLKNHLNENNVSWIYELAIFYDNIDLINSCELIIGMDTKTLIKSPSFIAMDRKILRRILSLNWLSCTEVELFEACMDWIMADSNQNHLTKELVCNEYADIFDGIRFGSMSLEQFVDLTPSYRELFSYDDYVDIIQSISKHESNQMNSNIDFLKREMIPWNEHDVIRCYRSISQFYLCKPYQIKNVEKTIFTTNKPVLLRGIAFDGIYEYNYIDHKYSIPVASLPTQLTILKSPIDLDSDERKTIHIEKGFLMNGNCVVTTMPKPILIRPGFMYEIRLEQKPSSNCCNGAILKPQVNMEHGITIKFHHDPIFFGDPNVLRGLIYALDFYRF